MERSCWYNGRKQINKGENELSGDRKEIFEETW